MSKIHSQSLSKESLIAIGLTIVVFILLVVNLIVLIPLIIQVYSPQNKSAAKEPINPETVNEALKIIEESKNN